LSDDDNDEHQYEMPGGCSNFGTASSEDDEDGTIDVRINYKELCPAQIAGITVGVVVLAAVLIVAAVTLSGGGSVFAGGSTGDYVVL
jgi:hypothetical protein